jgi:hypothetical protein
MTAKIVFCVYIFLSFNWIPPECQRSDLRLIGAVYSGKVRAF